MKKKTFLIALFTVVCTLSYADDEVEVTVDGLRYSCDLVAQTAKVIRGDDYTGLTKVNIPSTVMCQEKECTVTEIGESAFSECEKIRDLTLPATLKIIRQSAFQGCQKIYKLQLPEGLEVIESQVFYGCSMPEVIIPEGVTSIGFWAFNSNTFLKRVELPSTLTYLEDHVFDMTKLTTVISHITEPFELSEDAFMGTKAFLFVPEGLRGAYLATEGWNAFPNIFEGERGEATVNGLDFVYGTLSDIAVLVKGDYSEMEKIDIPASFTVDEKEYTVTEIQDEAFAWCKFNEAVIPEGVEKIGEKVFSECQNLVKVALPSTLKKIGTGAIDFNLSNHKYTWFAANGNNIRGNLKVTSGTTVEDLITQMSVDEDEIIARINSSLGPTGIDIVNQKITLTAANTVINGNLNLYDSNNSGFTVYDDTNTPRVNI